MRLYYPSAIDIYGKLHVYKSFPSQSQCYSIFEMWERDYHCLLTAMWIDETDDSDVTYHRQIKVTKSYQEVTN